MGPEIPLNRPELAAGMAGSHPLLCLPTSGAQNHLHDKCNREPESRHPQNHQKARQLSNRRCRNQANLSRDPQFREGRSVLFAIIIQWGKDIVYINATSTRECTFALSFAR